MIKFYIKNIGILNSPASQCVIGWQHFVTCWCHNKPAGQWPPKMAVINWNKQEIQFELK